MPVKKYRPTAPGRRFITTMDFSELSKVAPERSLVEVSKKHSGRNNNGHITVRHKGGGTRTLYRIIDFKRTQGRHSGQGRDDRVRSKPFVPHRAAQLQRRREALHSGAARSEGRRRRSNRDPNADIKIGNCLPIKNIPVGTVIHNIELRPGQGGKLVRSAGVSAQLMAKEDEYSQVRMPSGEVRKIHIDCRATIGQLGNVEHENKMIGKAGRSRHLGKRP